jgi:transcriptional regulator with XRE-family HTH domain
MSFGARLAEERKRLGLKQIDFADLVGTDSAKQSLYENDRRALRADYLARLADAGADVVYILTGRRSESVSLGEGASELLSAYFALPPELQEALQNLARSLRTELGGRGAPTLHARKLDYRAGESSRS